MNFIKKYYKWLIVLICLFIFILIANVIDDRLLNIDAKVYNILTFFKNDIVTMFFKIITNFVCTPFLIILSLCTYFILKKQNKTLYSRYLLLDLILIIGINIFLKQIFSRARPIDLMLINESGFSFPSGHAMVSMAFYGFIIYIINLSKVKYKNFYISLLALLILLIGISRIYLGVHYASDIIAGFCLSIAYLIVFINLIERENSMKGPLYKSFVYALEGIIACLKKERNFKIHFVIALIVIFTGFILKISLIEWFICLILIGTVIALELLNTAIENTIDICMPEINSKAKLAKDAAAGAVLVVVVIAIIIGLIIFIPKVLDLINK